MLGDILSSKALQNTKKYMKMRMTELRSDWLIGYYVFGRNKFSVKTISVSLNNQLYLNARAVFEFTSYRHDVFKVA